jgi:putative polyhydroxyalkanoate system protein
MATIDIRRSHSLDLAIAKERAEKMARDMESELGIVWKWDGDRIRFNAPSGAAKGATGAVSVDNREVRVEIELPFLLRPLKGMVSGKVESRLNELVR